MAENKNIRISVNVNDKQLEGLDEQFQKTAISADNASESIASMAKPVARAGKAAGSARQTLTSLTFTLRDAPHFANSASMGFLAISNNLDMLIDGFVRVKQETGSAKSAFKVLLGTLAGPAGMGVIVAAITASFTALGFVLTNMSRASKKASKANKEQKKSIEELVETYNMALPMLGIGGGTSSSAGIAAIKAGKQRGEIVSVMFQKFAKSIKLTSSELRKYTNMHSAVFGKNKSLIDAIFGTDDSAGLIANMRIIEAINKELKDTLRFLLVAQTGDLIKRGPGGTIARRAAGEGMYRSVGPGAAPGQVKVGGSDKLPERELTWMKDAQIAAASLGSVIQQTIVASLANGVNAARAFSNAFQAMMINMAAQLVGNAALFAFLNMLSGGLGGQVMGNSFFGAGLFANMGQGVGNGVGAEGVNIVMQGMMDGQTFLRTNMPKYEKSQSLVRR